MPNLVGAHNNLGNALRKTSHMQEAIEHYKQALELNPSFAECALQLRPGLGRFETPGRIHRAIPRRLAVQSGKCPSSLRLGQRFASAGRTQEAIEEYQQALQLRPDYSEAEASLLAINSGDAGVGQATQSAEESAPAVPGSVVAVYNLAVAQLNANKPQLAKENFQRVLEADPDNAAAHKGLGAALMMLGQPAKAIEHFQMVAKLKPDDAEAQNNLATA